MEKALVIPLTDEELQELYRVLVDWDKDAALEFLDLHVRGSLCRALEGG